MPRHPSALPQGLPDIFTVRAAVESGVPRGRLDRQDLRRPYHGVRVTHRVVEDSSLLGACREYAPRLKPWQFFSHETALMLLGVATPEWPYRPGIHVSAHRPAREPRVVGVVGHRLQVREPAILETAHGLRIEHPVRAWRQAGGCWRIDDLIAAADHLASGQHPLASLEELRDEVETMGDVRSGMLRRALLSARSGPRSPRETRLRLLIVRAGLPEPEINWLLRDSVGHPLAELDLAYPRWRVAPEYDGRVHAEDARQFARDADRWDRIRAAGWDHVRILNHHMARGGVDAVTKVRDALIRAGWRPRR